MNKKKQTDEAEIIIEEVTSAEPEKKEPENVVYLGPSIPKCVNHGTVFSGGIPPFLEEKIEKIPAIRGLIVPVSLYAETAMGVKTPGRLKTLYDLVAKEV